MSERTEALVHLSGRLYYRRHELQHLVVGQREGAEFEGGEDVGQRDAVRHVAQYRERCTLAVDAQDAPNGTRAKARQMPSTSADRLFRAGRGQRWRERETFDTSELWRLLDHASSEAILPDRGKVLNPLGNHRLERMQRLDRSAEADLSQNQRVAAGTIPGTYESDTFLARSVIGY